MQRTGQIDLMEVGVDLAYHRLMKNTTPPNSAPPPVYADPVAALVAMVQGAASAVQITSLKIVIARWSAAPVPGQEESWLAALHGDFQARHPGAAAFWEALDRLEKMTSTQIGEGGGLEACAAAQWVTAQSPLLTGRGPVLACHPSMTKTPRPLPDLTTMPAPKLRALIERLDAANSANVSALIEAGLGSYRYSDTAALANAEPDSPNGKLAALSLALRYNSS